MTEIVGLFVIFGVLTRYIYLEWTTSKNFIRTMVFKVQARKKEIAQAEEQLVSNGYNRVATPSYTWSLQSNAAHVELVVPNEENTEGCTIYNFENHKMRKNYKKPPAS